MSSTLRLAVRPAVRPALAVIAGVTFGLYLSATQAHDQAGPRDDTQPIASFPDVDGLKVLSVDLHTHSVFSDGHVWPSIRAEEAARDAIDGIAITEHLEWQPHLSDIPNPDRNRAYHETVRSAKKLDVLVIPGVEITRLDDPGHINAVFIQDANPLVQASGISDYQEAHLFETEAEAVELARSQSEAFAAAHNIERDGKIFWAPFESRAMYMTLLNFGVAAERDPRTVLNAAAEQGAFTFWNHPSFDTANSKLSKFHASAIKGGVLHGVEIANGDHYYPNAHRLAMKHGLTLIGTSDVHQLIAWDYDRQKNQHRPVTLVLAAERSEAGIKKALFEKRTVVLWNHTLIGRKSELQPLLEASVTLEQAEPANNGRTRLFIRNHSSATLQATNASKFQTAGAASTFSLPGSAVTQIDVRVDGGAGILKLKILNALIAPNEPAQIDLPFES